MCEPLKKLKEALLSRNIKTVAIVMHPNPDPDCIGAALGLNKILQTWNSEIKTSYLYSGEISHAQNKTMVNVLNIAMVNINELEDIDSQFDTFIAVDVMPERCFGEDKREFLMVIDHHKSDTELAEIRDIRYVGATSSIIWDYMQKEGIELQDDDNDSIVATALAMGIKSDTSDLVTENTTDLDWEASQGLMGYIDRRKLQAITHYPIPPYHFELRSKLDKDENIKIHGSVFVGGVGYISPTKRDALPTMADERSRAEGIDTAFVFAIVGDFIEVSVRSVGLSVDVNALCQKIFGKQYAGGKMGAGASKIPLGFLALDPNMSDELKAKMWEAVKELMIDKILHVVSGNA